MPLYLTFPEWIKPEILPGILPFRWYGLMYIIAFVITYALFNWQVKQKKLDIPKETVANFFFSGLIGLIIGARIFATLIYDTSGVYWQKPWLIFWPFDERMQFTGLAGMSFHGGLVGVIAGVLIYTKMKKIDLVLWGDMLVAAIPLGYTFGRLGNFINSELWGRVTTLPWGMVFPNGEPLSTKESWVQDVMHQSGISTNEALVNLPRHPSQLYEALGEGLLLWLVLWFVLRNRAPFKGFMIGCYMMGYGLIRFIIEYFRTPDKGLDFPLMFEPVKTTSHLNISLVNFSTGQIFCFLMIVGGAIALATFAWLDKRSKPALKTKA